MTHTHDADVRALEALVVDNPELERLEALLDQFNIFEALGATRQELRHSDFLAYLLNPRQPHGLDDAFVKHLLRRVLSAERGRLLPIGLIDLDVWDLDGMTVRREWENIDILLLDEQHHLAIIIENKIDSSEHSNQLQRYWEMVHQRYPGWRVIGLYLTPDGASPSHNRYFTLGYATICITLEELLQRRAATIGADVQVLVNHYTDMLRRHIVGNSELGQLCQRIYLRHRRAFDLINQHIQERVDTRRKLIENLIRQHQAPKLELEPGSGGGVYTRFIPQPWDVQALRVSKGWTQSRRILLFEFENKPDSLKLALTIGPGLPVTRARLFDIVLANLSHFNPGVMTLQPRYHWIMQRSILTADQIGEMNDAELATEIRRAWQTFVDGDLPGFDTVLRAQNWIWQAGQAEPTPTDDIATEELIVPAVEE